MNQATMPYIPILIVGAGPTGLVLAAALSRYGIPLRLIEKKPGLSRYTKASNLMIRSQEVLGALGITMPLDEIGGPMRGIVYEVHGRCLGVRTMLQPDTPYAGVLLCGQNRLEERVKAKLEQSGVVVEFETSLVHAEQLGDGVIATLRTEAGEARVRCDWLIGCDGASGPTRTFTKWNFTPHRTGVACRQVDCRMQWRRSTDQSQMWLFYFTNGFLAVVPLPGGMYRIATHEPIENLPSGKPQLAEMEAKLRQVTGDPSCRLYDLDWSTHTDLSMGIADGLRDGRIVLAGDCGNSILPNGGQGMNVGILDAFNLGWKLAAVVNGSTDELIDTYATERLALRASLEKFQWNSLKYTTLQTSAWLRWAMPRIAELALNHGGEEALGRVFNQLGENTRASAMTLELSGKKGLRAGDRVPDADVVIDGRLGRLFDVVYTGRWSLLAFSGTGNSTDADAASSAAAAFDGVNVAVFVVTVDRPRTGEASVVDDLDENAHRALKLTEPMIYLVRPDGYVAARARPEDAARLFAHAARWLTPGALPARRARSATAAIARPPSIAASAPTADAT